MIASVLQVHDTTLPHLDFIEKILLDELIRLGKAEIVSENMPVKSAVVGGRDHHGVNSDNS